MKLTGGIILALLCVTMGFAAARRLRVRCGVLQEFIYVLERIRGDIEERRTALPVLLETLERDRPKLSEFFAKVRRSWAEDGYLSFSKAWAGALETLPVTEEDRLMLSEAGGLLGRFDADTQADGLKRAVSFIEEQLREARELRAKNEKILQTLGLAGGLVIVILVL